MADLHVTWDDYLRDNERLAREVHRSGWSFDQIVCIARGGLRVGDTLSRVFDIPLAIISTQSYGGEAGTVRGHIRVAEHLTMTTARLGTSEARGGKLGHRKTSREVWKGGKTAAEARQGCT